MCSNAALLALVVSLECALASEPCVQTESCNPPPPPVMNEGIDWTVLGAVLGGLYAFVMACVVATTCGCWAAKRPHTQQANTLPGGGRNPMDRQGSWMKRRDIQPQFDLEHIENSIKMGFIRKVYAILATQLALTVIIVMAMLYLSFEIRNGGPDASAPTAFGYWLFARWWIMLASIIPIIAIYCVLQKQKSNYPTNYILLFVFTVLESITLGLLCVYYYAAVGIRASNTHDIPAHASSHSCHALAPHHGACRATATRSSSLPPSRWPYFSC